MVQTRLLEIAIREFGSKGLDGASTRDIAAAANTAMSSITYHFGGKEGLYLAAADHIAERMGMVGEALDFASADNPEGARDLLKTMLSRMVDKVAGAENEALFIVREQMNPTEAFDRIWNGPMGTMWQRMTQLVCTATRSSDRRTCRIVTLTLFGQAIALRASRASFERLSEASLDDAALLADVKSIILANTDAILDRLAANPETYR
jgi:AcrR family transcriptional regulator